MLAEDLIAIAAVHGVDLQHVAGIASDTKGVARRRKRTKVEVRLGLEVVDTATGRHTRTYRRPAWSIAELGQGAKDVPETPWNAVLYSFAGDRDVYWPLWEALSLEAHRLARRERWAARVKGEDGKPQFYHDELADLVLTEEANQHFFLAAPSLYAFVMKVTPPAWEASLEPRYRSLKGVYSRWLDVGRSMIQRWM